MAKNLEISHLIWLNVCINSEDNINTQRKLKLLIDHLKIFEDIIECEKYIQSISLENQIILIISGDLSQKFIPQIHQYQQIYSIYIYCLNKEFYQPWSKQYLKIKGVYNELEELIAQIPDNRIRRRKKIISEPLSMCIDNTNFNNEQTTSALNGRLVHSQLLIDCLLRMPPTSNDKDDFISLYLKKYIENEQDLQTIEKFKESYSLKTAVEWYTKESFLYRILNKSLRIQDIDLLFSLRFLIRDIEQKLKEYRCLKPVRLYRGQFISDEELDILKQSKGNLISINPFFSTTMNRNVAMLFLDTSDKNYSDKLKRVLFEIDANPHLNEIKPFADISSLSSIPDEEEVLMMLGTIFRLNHIYLDQHQIWVVNMTLCSDHDHDVKAVFNHMKDQYGSEQTRLLVFGHVLVDMAHFNDAEKYYHRLLEELTDNHSDLSHCYHALGKVASEKGDYELSLQWLYKSLETLEKTGKKDHPQIGFIHICIGEVHQRRHENDQALKFYEKALACWTKTYTIEHEYVAWCFNNIAIIYDAQKKYHQALDYYKKALNIKEKNLPSQHPCLGNTYLNIGNVYYHLGQHDEALKNYRKAHNIYEISLTPEHPSVANAIKNIGIIYEVQGKYSEALKNYKKASAIRQHTFLTSHPDSIQIDKDIEGILLKIEKLEKKEHINDLING